MPVVRYLGVTLFSVSVRARDMQMKMRDKGPPVYLRLQNKVAISDIDTIPTRSLTRLARSTLPRTSPIGMPLWPGCLPALRGAGSNKDAAPGFVGSERERAKQMLLTI